MLRAQLASWMKLEASNRFVKKAHKEVEGSAVRKGRRVAQEQVPL